MSTIINANHYQVFIGNDTFIQLDKFLAKHYSGRKIFVLVDEHTRALCLPLISERIPVLQSAVVLEIKSGEENKSLETAQQLWSQLTALDAGRRSLLINLGGGVVGDVGGFVASTFVRGINFINIPTTLLAMVDASTGGKNGINFSGLKNQVGTFTRPDAVFISPSFLKTLPENELRSGFAEVIKHALIADKEKWEEIRQIENFSDVNWVKLISHSVMIKNKIVNADFKDRTIRRTLNFGHTIGHALESYSLAHHVTPLKHGEAIAIGMIGELFLSSKMKDFPVQEANEITSFILKSFNYLSPEADTAEIVKLIHSDKKNEMSRLNFVLLEGIGRPVINQFPGEQMTAEAVEYAIHQFKAVVDHY